MFRIMSGHSQILTRFGRLQLSDGAVLSFWDPPGSSWVSLCRPFMRHMQVHIRTTTAGSRARTWPVL